MIWPGLAKDITESQENRNDYSLSIYLQTSDYFEAFTDNLAVIGILTLTLIIVWVGLAIAHRIGGIKIEPYCNNFALRLFYELFLEFCISAMVNISLSHFNDVELLSVFVLIAIVAYIGWLISLFFYNGPYLPGFYNKNSVYDSFWSVRPFATDFNAV